MGWIVPAKNREEKRRGEGWRGAAEREKRRERDQILSYPIAYPGLRCSVADRNSGLKLCKEHLLDCSVV